MKVGAPIRTNNDVEGWHTRLNIHCGRRYNANGLGLYLLIDVLGKEAELAEMYEEMLLQGQKLRRTRKNYAALNEKLKKLWVDHNQQKLTTESLLVSLAQTYYDFNKNKFANCSDDTRFCELED